MDTLTFISKVVDSVSWPVTIIAAVYILREPIGELLPFGTIFLECRGRGRKFRSSGNEHLTNLMTCYVSHGCRWPDTACGQQYSRRV